MKVDEHVDDPRPRPPTMKLCSCGADLFRKHLAGSNHLKAASGLRAPTSTNRTPVVQRPCAELKLR